jgi:predicted nucleic acid-binding protein
LPPFHLNLGLGWNKISNVLDEIRNVFVVIIPDFSVIQSACKIAERYRYSYFDSLIISSAMAAGVETLYTEDMKNAKV